MLGTIVKHLAGHAWQALAQSPYATGESSSMNSIESSWQTTAGTQVSTANRWRSRIMNSLSSSGLIDRRR
jgi:hypothetical protein